MQIYARFLQRYLLQAGVEEDYAHSWTPSFWWEDVPDSPQIQFIPSYQLAYNCGDEGYVYVDYKWTVANADYILMTDKTTGQSYHFYFYGFVPDQSTADWIDERPSCNGNDPRYYAALGNFGSDERNGYYWNNLGSFYSIGSGGGYYYDSINNEGNIAAPKQLFTDGTHPLAGFYDNWNRTGFSDC